MVTHTPLVRMPLSMNEELEIVQFFHENSKRNVYHIVKEPDFDIKPLSFKEYCGYERVILPSKLKLNMGLDDAITKRRSYRNFSDEKLTIDVVAKVLYFGYGITGKILVENYELLQRACPSGGALYPFELYLVVMNVVGLKDGLYHYFPIDHSLDVLRYGRFATKIASLFMEQHYVVNSGFCILLSGILERTTWKYGSRGYRYALLEAGHLVQNMCLVATSEGIGSLPLGGFYDDAMAEFIGLDPLREPVIYGLSVGHMRH